MRTREETVERVWTVYQWARGEFGKQPALLTPARREAIERALGMYPVEDLEDAARGWLYSAHHIGRNDRHEAYYDLAAHVLWTGTKAKPRNWLEAFRDLWRERRGQPYAFQEETALVAVAGGGSGNGGRPRLNGPAAVRQEWRDRSEGRR